MGFLNPVAANWHPLTVLSHMLDCQLFGLKPWGHHLTNVLLHALNAALVFVLLQQMTGATLAESVGGGVVRAFTRCASNRWPGWRNARMCSAPSLGCSRCFFTPAMLQAESEIRGQKCSDPKSAPITVWIYSAISLYSICLSLFFFALGLMSKPMLVTWPFVMLLLDYWPLRRVNASDSQLLAIRQLLSRLVWEKIPFFALAAAASVVTFVVQKQGGAVVRLKTCHWARASGMP